MIYVWTLFIAVFLLLCLLVVGIIALQAHQRRKALEMRGYRIEGDPDVDPRSADEP